MSVNANEFIPTRRSLLARIKDLGDQESWHDFFNTYWKLIYGVAIESGLGETEAQGVGPEAAHTRSFRPDKRRRRCTTALILSASPGSARSRPQQRKSKTPMTHGPSKE